MIRYLVTDLDGTLFDTRRANAKAYVRAFADVGAPITADDYLRHFGLRFDALAYKLAPHLSEAELGQVRLRKQSHYREAMTLVRPNQPLITWLEARHPTHPIGLATTASRHNAENLLERFGVLSLFDCVVYGEDVSHGKPNPECYTKCIELLGGKPRETLIFEDSEVGVAAAEAAGAQVTLVTIP